MIKIFLLTAFFCLFTFSCTNELDKRIEKVSYGTSFGECMGYCKHQMVITVDSAKYSCISNGNTLPQKDVYEKMTTNRWDSIRNNMTFSSLLALPEVIGCPDCADGGAEWLELMLTNGETHKVTFEYGKEPASIKDYIAKCRLILNKNSCQ
ncbi:MAG: hypothetical protein WCL70_06610 [Paludibacter sp.]